MSLVCRFFDALLRDGPYHDWKVRFVRKRAIPAISAPLEEIGFKTFPIAPSIGFYILLSKPALLQQVGQTLLRPPTAINRYLMNSYQKGRCNNEIAARPKHLVYVSAGSHWPRQMLKNLICYYQIELAIERFGANIK